MHSLYTTVQLANWKEWLSFVGDLSENWAFRGQADSRWELQNAIERTDFVQQHANVEAEFLAEFQRGARNYLTRDQTPEHLIEWLALMQHHGAPTRLLDFSKSPFIAAYFAYEVSDLYSSTHVAIWAMNIHYLKLRALEMFRKAYPGELGAHSSVVHEQLFEKIFYENKTRLVFPVEPFRMNRRYSLQQSIFVSTGTGPIPFMDQLQFLGDMLPRAVVKIELPATLQKSVLRALQQMNLNRVSLFPDLDGYAAALRLRYQSLRPPGEMLTRQLRKLDGGDNKLLP
jgi:hypothetical protein